MGRLRLEVGGTQPPPTLEDGDAVAVWARLRGPRLRPGGGGGDFFSRERIVATGYVESALLIERRPGGAECTALAGFSTARNAARRFIDAHVLGGTERGLVRAMVLGDRSEIDDATAEAFRRAGTYHVLALSGAQVALFAGIALLVLRRSSPVYRALILVPVLVAYAFFVGGDTPVTRATIMAVAVVLGRTLDLDADTPNVIGVAAVALLAVDPLDIHDPGFQLSFVATLALVVGTRPMLRGWPRWPLRMDVAIAASLVVQAALWPLGALHFHRLGLLAPVANLLAVPLSTAVLLAGLAVVVLGACWPSLAPLAGDVAWSLARALRLSCGPELLMEAVDFRVITPGPTLVLLAVAGFALLATGRRLVGGGLTLAGLLGTILGLPGPSADGRLHLTLLDVGQGDALVLRSPRGRVVLVDGGGRWGGGRDAGERVVAPYLWDQGAVSLDRVVVSHFHSDHAGGIPFLLSAFRVAELWEGVGAQGEEAYRSIRQTIDECAGTANFCPRLGSRFEWDGVWIEVRGPMTNGPIRERTLNEDSLVLSVTMGGTEILLTGDGGKDVEPGPASSSTVKKLPHHGSRTASSAFSPSSKGPRIALVSVGRNNRFRHPSPQVLRQYSSMGSLVLRSDQDGTIDIASDGARLWWRVESDASWHELP